MGTKAKVTTATGMTASAAIDLTRHEAEAAITVVEDGDGRKTVRVTASFDYTIEANEEGRWASGGILLGGKAVAEMGGNADWRLTLAYGLRNAGLAIGNRAVKAIEPPAASERAVSITALRRTAEAQVDGLIKAGIVKAADRAAAVDGAVAAATAEREARRADRVAKANGGAAAEPAAAPAK